MAEAHTVEAHTVETQATESGTPESQSAEAPIAAQSAPVEPVVRTFAQLQADELYGIMQLRSRAFVVEQECVFLDADGVDTLPETLHIFFPRPASAMADTHGAVFGRDLSPWAYARLLPADVPDGPAARPGARSISRVAAHPEARGQGWARRLLAGIVAEWSTSPLTLNAQSHLEGLYASFGFVANGPRFLEDGIEHTPMERPAS
jgi:ElaA protein